MDLEESPLWNEVQKVLNEGPKPIAYYWKGQFHTTEKYDWHWNTTDKSVPSENLDIMKIISIDNVCNYEANFGDELIIEVMVLMGDYIKIIYPNRAKLDITLFKEPLIEIGDDDKKNEFKESERFKAIPILEGLPTFEGSDLDIHKKFSLNLQTPLTISFQLFNRSLEKLRTVTVGGIYRKVLNEDVVKATLTNESLKIKIGGVPSILAVDVVPSDNLVKREHTIIPQGVKLLSLSTYIQEKCNGIYNYGIGTYLQRKVWYVYPLFNTKRYNEAKLKAIIYKIPKNKLHGVERTYRVDGRNTLHILATSSSKFEDDANTNFMNEGNGVRLADAKQFMNKPNKTSDNKTVISRKTLNNEVVYGAKEDGLNVMFNSFDVIGDNMFLEKTRIAARDGSIVTFTWDNANPKYLIPGMMMKIVYMDNDVMQELTGVLLSNHVFVQLNGTGITVKRHITTCNLSIFVNKVKK